MKVEFLNVSSADRDKALYETSSDCTIDFDKFDTVTSLRLKNAEIPHTRYAISDQNNTLYFSEIVNDVINFYHVKVSQASYTASELGTTLTLSMLTPYAYNNDVSPVNTYTFSTAGSFGKMAMVSSGDVSYALHLADETVAISSYEALSSTMANIRFFSSRAKLIVPGSLLTLKMVPYSDREIQVVSLEGNYGVRVIGDFSDIDSDLIDTSSSTMVPYSSVNNISLVMGFADYDSVNGSSSSVLGIQSPFGSDTTNLATIMVTTDLPNFSSTGASVLILNGPGFLDNQVLTVSKVKDDTHFQLDVDRRTLWAHTGGKLAVSSNLSTSYTIASISIFEVDNNVITLTVGLAGIHDLDPNERVSFVDFTAHEMRSATATVISVPSPTSVRVRFVYPMNNLFDSSTKVSLVNPTTHERVAYLTPYRFDLSRGRRLILVHCATEGIEIGAIRIPALVGKKFFARIALSSGGEVVNFAALDTLTSYHYFEAPLQRFRSIAFTFYNEDGTLYTFSGTDWSMLFQVETQATAKV
jgi:hypothetical protein